MHQAHLVRNYYAIALGVNDQHDGAPLCVRGKDIPIRADGFRNVLGS